MLKSLLTLSFGTALSQIILISCTPLLTRLYSSSEFGHFYFFMSIVSLITCCSTLKYELAIFLPKTDTRSFYVMQVAFIFICIFTVLSLLIICCFKVFGFFSGNILIKSSLIFFVPLCLFLSGLLSVLNLWFNRQKNYFTIIVISLLQSIINVIICLLYPHFFKASFIGLLGGYISSLSLSVILYVILFLKYAPHSNIGYIKIKRFKSTIIKYANFPKFTLWTEFLLVFSQQFLPFFFSIFFLSSTVGLIAMANRILRLPVIMISASFWSIFRNNAIYCLHSGSTIHLIYNSTLKKLSILAFFGFIGSIFLLPFLFKFFLGDRWIMAGKFAQITLLGVCLEFVSFPLTNVFVIMEKQKYLFKLQLSGLVLALVSIYVAYFLTHSSFYCLISYTLAISIQNILIITTSYKLVHQYPGFQTNFSSKGYKR